MKNFFKKHATVIGVITTATVAVAVAAVAVVTGKVIIPGGNVSE